MSDIACWITDLIFNSIEWGRKYGIRIFLDLHALPGSQNGWVSPLTLSNTLSDCMFISVLRRTIQERVRNLLNSL